MISPTKSQESVSVYKEYKKFLVQVAADTTNPLSKEAKNVTSKPILGFNTNRFGRLAELSTLFLEHLPLIIEFFDHAIDENQNKLYLACYCYMKSNWFKICCQVVSELDEVLVQPLKLALGIDEYKKVRSEHRSWYGLKEVIPELLMKLENVQSVTGAEKMRNKVFSEVKVAVERHFSTVKFYSDPQTMSQEKLMKIGYAPLTNSGGESNFGDLTYDVTRSAGSDTNMHTFSNKNMIRRNKLFESQKWKELSAKQRKARWKWARSSQQAKKVREIGKTYYESVKVAKQLCSSEKENKKKAKRAKANKFLDECKKHWSC